MIDKQALPEPRSIKDLCIGDDLAELHRRWITDPRNLAEVEGILDLVPKDVDSVLDYGCGTGRYSQHFENYVGVDISPILVEFARKTYPGKTFITRMEFAKRHRNHAPRFNLVMAISVVQYWDDEQALKIISDMAALSKRYLLIQTWDPGETGSRRFQTGFKGVGEYVRPPSFYFDALLKFGDVVRLVLEVEKVEPATVKVIYMVTESPVARKPRASARGGIATTRYLCMDDYSICYGEPDSEGQALPDPGAT